MWLVTNFVVTLLLLTLPASADSCIFSLMPRARSRSHIDPLPQQRLDDAVVRARLGGLAAIRRRFGAREPTQHAFAARVVGAR
jgi:hypothetical protein